MNAVALSPGGSSLSPAHRGTPQLSHLITHGAARNGHQSCCCFICRLALNKPRRISQLLSSAHLSCTASASTDPGSTAQLPCGHCSSAVSRCSYPTFPKGLSHSTRLFLLLSHAWRPQEHREAGRRNVGSAAAVQISSRCSSGSICSKERVLGLPRPTQHSQDAHSSMNSFPEGSLSTTQ